MLTLLFGDNIEARAKKRQQLEEAAKKEGKELIEFTFTTYSEGALQDYFQDQSLFGTKYIVTLKEVLSLEDAVLALETYGKTMQVSATEFIYDSSEASKDIQKIFTKLDADVQQFSAGEKKKKRESFNVFALPDAFNQRDKKNLWVLYTEALRNGVTPEEIGGVLLWNLKNLALYFDSKDKSASSTGLAPFVFSKVKSAGAKFTKEEVATHAENLTKLTHESRIGNGDSATLLELFILKAL